MENGRGAWFVVGILLFLFLICGGLYGCPQYNVYSSRLNGEAIKAQAEGSKQALVSQALAEKEAAANRAGAALIRSTGIANAAKAACTALGLPNDRQCLLDEQNNNWRFGIVREAHEGTSLVMGLSGANVSVPVGTATTSKSSE